MEPVFVCALLFKQDPSLPAEEMLRKLVDCHNIRPAEEMLRKPEGTPHNIRPAEETVEPVFVRALLFKSPTVFHHFHNFTTKNEAKSPSPFTHCFGCNPFQSRGCTIKFILAKN